MKRRYGLLALAVLALLLLNLSWQEAPTRPAHTGQLAQPATAASPQTQPPLPTASGPVAATAVPAGPAPAPAPASWRELPDEMNRQLASEVSDSEQPLAERLANLEAIEAQWLSEGESLFRLQGRYALALEQLAQEHEQLPLAERLAALTRLQDEWAADHLDLAAELFNPAARLQQARQLWGDEELTTLAYHFLPAGQAEATVQFAASRQQQLTQRSHYQQQLTELEQQLAASRGNMDEASWQQHREAVLGQFRRDFFAQTPDQP
ncbi:hypothetical protein H9X88_16040 [Aeromonas hydrophila]|uniref:hypothetical protein n=1 Tax=Aeromonas hydrophila TaxID=644 RepID=UPI0019164B9A|nr:hypothetical protein [Aeromonas hydrophila]MBQ4675232.1 hypothetical protein [Aeromonas hydrophila]MBW3815546.1 hypothetical protein [Aeromonas hydrophila]MCF7679598.1 hypothetical protein [Aeromonas hydrophila]MCF7692644.1 hypothetical protein [Aeromonas hydrophila]MCF7773671.1 hypothetical protein [Aeromonas hydrophila]